MNVCILIGDVRERALELPSESVHCAVTSPPYYGLRDYGVVGQIGIEPSPAEYIAELVAVFREVRRILRNDGTLWLNIGDSYAGSWGAEGRRATDSDDASWHGSQIKNHPKRAVSARGYRSAGIKPKDLIGIPWMLAFALRDDGWYLRQDIIWSKPNPMPESVTDRCTKAHEYLFLLSKSKRYWYDQAAILDPCSPATHARLSQDVQAQIGSDRAHAGGKTNGTMKAVGRKLAAAGNGIKNNTSMDAALAIMLDKRNRRSVWEVPTQPFSDWTETVRQIGVAWDAPVDGKKRKASPDCPVHADRSVRETSARGDERVVGSMIRSERTDGRRDQAPLAGSAPTARHREPEIEQQNSGLPLPSRSTSATQRNTQSRRTGLAPETNPACTLSARTADRTADTTAKRELIERDHDTAASNIVEADSADNQGTQRSAGTSDITPEQASFVASVAPVCTCEWYTETTEKTSHFATFPPALIEPCILAGCPKGGVVLDPFGGAGTVGLVADRMQRDAILIELNPDYAGIARRRIDDDAGPMFGRTATLHPAPLNTGDAPRHDRT